ncbi:centrosome-associated protein 350 isoform X2 [Genypterus blacodes]|uniref:centrosome-associated protein 350 isoform X2 n=1 Tax=Genypterus blacodes TaxID=154954 RepID=UPI003F75B91D
MRSSKRAEVSVRSSAQQLPGHNNDTDLTAPWKSLTQSKAALRHIENHLEAVPGTGVLLELVMDPKKKKSSKRAACRDGHGSEDLGGSSKRRGRTHQSPEKSSSRSPLRNTTQESNVCRNITVEFREPLASFRDATPPPPPSSRLETYSLNSVPGCLHSSSPPASDSFHSQLVYQRDTRDRQTDRDLDSTHSSALESTEVCYLNDLPALSALRAFAHQSHPTGVKAPSRVGTDLTSTPIAHITQSMDSQESSPCLTAPDSASSSPGSASQRLENLRKHQPDNKLEKLKERIRRQRQHLEEAAERDKLLGYLDKPLGVTVGSNTVPTAKVRKVAAAPPAPVYKGLNSTETKIRTPDGKVWKEEEFHNLSREFYRDLSLQYAESPSTRQQQQKQQRPADRSKERRPPKPVRKVQRPAPASDLKSKTLIGPASWRDGQKVVKMMLGQVSKSPRDDGQPAERLRKTDHLHRSTSTSRSESSRRSRPNSNERGRSGTRAQSNSRSKTTHTHPSPPQDKASAAASTELLSADIQGILDDLQLECKAAEREQRDGRDNRGRRGRGGSGSRTRAPVSAWGSSTVTFSSQRGCRSASPTARQKETASAADMAQKKRHYDADTVRQYITRQQEDRKRRQAEEKRSQREEAERRNQRLQELYRKQRLTAKAAALPPEAPGVPVQRRLQETYDKLLLEESTHMQPIALSSQLQRQMYQPSGESDKENKRLEPPQSPSSSDRSLTELPPPLSRNDLDLHDPSLLHPVSMSPPVRPTADAFSSPLAPSGDHLLSQLLRLETAMAAREHQHTRPQPTTRPLIRPGTKDSRIEAIKASAAFLSDRLEREARKLVGEGINYGVTTAVDMDNMRGPTQTNLDDDDGGLVGMSSPLLRDTAAHATADNNVASRIQKILLSAGQSSYNGLALPGVGNLHALRGLREKTGTHTNMTTHAQQRRMVNGTETLERTDKMGGHRRGYEGREERRTDLHESSGGSISEGPLSEGSFSEDDASALHLSHNHTPRPTGHLRTAEHCAAHREDSHRLAQFQREAAKCLALNSPFAQQDGSRAAWEDLNKGSPLSVINIFTKNLQGHFKVGEDRSERNSPSVHTSSGLVSRDMGVYEDDFVSSPNSAASGHTRQGYNSHSVNSPYEDLIKGSPHEQTKGGISPYHSSFHSSHQSPHLSSGLPSASSPLSKSFSRRERGRGKSTDQSDGTLVEEQRSSNSPSSEALSSESRKAQSRSTISDYTPGGASGHSHHSLGPDSKKTPAGRTRLASPPASPDLGSSPGAESPSESLTNGSAAGPSRPNTHTAGRSGRANTKTTGELQYSPAVMHQRMTAELHYLAALEESIRQLGDVEKLRAVSVAQQESVSLAHMIKAQQQRHEEEVYELKIKAEREALETQLHLEESRQRVAKAHVDLQESMVMNQKESLGGLQEATTKMMSQQAEAARYTADAARHIKEMTELARSQIAGALIVPPVAAPVSTLLDQREEQPGSKQLQAKADNDRSEHSGRRSRPEEPLSSFNSLSHSDSQSFRRPNYSGADSSSKYSASHVSSDSKSWKRKEGGDMKRKKDMKEREAASSSIEEDIPTAANDSVCSDSIHSVVDDKGDSTSVATEYSLKFDESMTEDEIEERSFRSLLPSEAHRRGTLEKKSRQHEELEEDPAHHNTTEALGVANHFKDASTAFSCGQDSFSQFTMDMVRQYMKDEEVRLQHQSSLLHLRQKALKEKTKAELAWLEHQKKTLRDKGEDDKMPPIRKKQRGLLMKLQQEQAEIKRLQEANKAARKERLLLLKQQEEIERMRSSTLRLKERLKCAGGEEPPETPMSETPVSAAASPSGRRADEDTRSPSPPLSISGSETSSIMQKLKKMRSHMDEKNCSPVHCFFSVFTSHHWASLSVCLPNLHPKFQLFIYNQLSRFLTKREQQLVNRRRHAEELLLWKRQLDQEEAEVRRMEKEALAALDRQTSRDQDHNASHSPEKRMSDISPASSHHQSSEHRPSSETGEDTEYVNEATSDSSIHTERLASQQPESPSPARPASLHETPLTSVQSSPPGYTQDFSSASPPHSRHSTAPSKTDGSSKTKIQLHPTCRTPAQTQTRPTDTPVITDPVSDQSDIEGRIRALKEELRKRKFMAYKLKREQKKRQKERLKAQEANLLKQLESYNNFIQKTKAELNKQPDPTAVTKPCFKDDTSAAELSSNEPSTPQRSETNKIFNTGSEPEWTHTDSPSHHSDVFAQAGRSRSTSLPEDLSDEDPPTLTPTPMHGSPEHPSSELKRRQTPEVPPRPPSKEAQAAVTEADENIVSDIQEELDVEASNKSDGRSECILKLFPEDKLGATVSDRVLPSVIEHQPAVGLENNQQIKKSSEAEEVVKALERNGRSCSTDSVTVSAKKEKAVPSPLADYHNDFESSVDSSPREEKQSSKPAETKSSGKGSGSSQDEEEEEEVEEDLPAELSHHSGVSIDNHYSGWLLDLNGQTGVPQHADKDIDLSPLMDEMLSFNIGDRVLVGGVQPGTLRFKGTTRFANGFWAGVELDKSEGSNNGTYDGVAYFVCQESHGIFAPPDKITHLSEKFEMYPDTTTEDEDSFLDDSPDKDGKEHETDEGKCHKQRKPKGKTEQSSYKEDGSRDKAITDDTDQSDQQQKRQTPLKTLSHLNFEHHRDSEHQVTNGRGADIILHFEDAPTSLLIFDADKLDSLKQSPKEMTTIAEQNNLEPDHQRFTPNDLSAEVERKDTGDLQDTVTDKLLTSIVTDALRQFAEIKKAKEQKISAANQTNRVIFAEPFEDQDWVSSVDQKDGLPFFPIAEKEELRSPELRNRPESPVLGISGQEELAKRLAELELSRELLDEEGDEQDWFDEDFGLSSRREQQRLKQMQREEEEEEEEEARLGGLRSGSGVGLGGEQPVKTPPRPELPLPLPPKLPEQPAMVVPHSATEVEKMVHAATQEIWKSCRLGTEEGTLSFSQIPDPQPSQEYLGKEPGSQDQEALSIRSYRKAVYDLTWEILQEVYAEDPNAHKPQWVKPRRVRSSCFHRVRTPGDITSVQDYVTTEVLTLYGLAKDQNQKTDWQKMLKFGRKKRDKVDHILVQELHEEEALWVNYDEDELFVKMQLADSVFDALLKDTANALTLISDTRDKRAALS